MKKILFLLAAFCAAPALPAQDKLAPAEAAKIAEEAYIYGYSLITTEVTRVQMTNVPKQEGLQSPMGQFTNVKRYPPGDYRGVSAPNADTLYSLAWVDVGEEPWVFSHPDMGDRYYLFPMYSLWMPVIDSPGKRTAGGGAKIYVITGPNWKGDIPKGAYQIKCPTRYMVILGRTYSTGTPEDYEAVNKLQEQYKLHPFSSWGKPYTPPAESKVDPNPGFSMTDKPQQVIDAMGTSGYFNMLAKLMGGPAPAPAEDTPMLAKMAKLGIVPGQPFDMAKLDPAVQAAIKDTHKTALAKISAQQKTGGKLYNGWLVPGAAGSYGTDYLARALIAEIGWPANLPQDAVYPTTFVDGKGDKLNGANKYTLTFPRGQTPPVDGFWSITMYFDDGGWWFYPNPLNKFTVSMRDNPKFNADGSLTLYFQNESPGKDKEANWLPCPKGDFLLTMRMYWPKATQPSILPPGQGTWAPPAVVKAAADAKTGSAPASLSESAKIAEEAYEYAFPLVMNYGTMYEFAIDKSSSQYKAPFNQIYNMQRVATPQDTAIVTPNSDTPYSMAWLDLRSEPLVVNVPEIEKARYYSVQLVDLYTFNYGYIGSRATGNGAGTYMIAGPNWKGETPKGVQKVFRCETDFTFALFRTQLFNPADIENVKKIQAGYKIQPLSAFLGQAAPPAAPEIKWPKIDKKLAETDPFAYLNFLLQFCPPVGPAVVEKPLRERFAKIGIEAGKPFEADKLSPERKADLEMGVKVAFGKIKQRLEDSGKVRDGWMITKAFGDRAFYNGNWTLRAAAAMGGIYGNDDTEALYPLLLKDGEGNKPDCDGNRYTITFPAGQLPPVNAFWSVTMYDGKTQLLVENPLNRYLVNSPMLPDLKKNADGSLTLYIQKDSPGKDKESNWLPAPAGPIYVVMRLYWPKPEALDGKWMPPAVKLAK